jgi:hypothetical protein
MENELEQSPAELASNAESASLSTLPPRAKPPPLANLYDDLGDGQIRLFELDTNTTGNVVGRLRTVQITSAPPFYALSYVCGSDSCSEEITINNRAVLVKPNLFAALQELRSYFQVEHIAQITIWIDAICINQGNEDEKARQIRSMHGVFSGAVEVLVWLGAVDDNIRMVLRVFSWLKLSSDLRPDFDALRQHRNGPGYQESISEPRVKALNSLDNLTHCLEVCHRITLDNLLSMIMFLAKVKEVFDEKELTRGDCGERDKALRVATNVPIVDAGLLPPDHIFWPTLYSLSNLEWFERVWTYQEVLLARDARLLSHGVMVPWKGATRSLEILLPALMLPGTFNKSRTQHLPPSAEMGKSWRKWIGLQSNSPSGFGGSLLYTLIATKHRVSTVAEDSVYGLIGLWQSKVQAEIVIDYTKETAEVFANAVKIGLKMEETTSIADLWTSFDHSPSVTATEGLPSWCPDFQHTIDSPMVGYEPLSPTIRDRIETLACYKHTSDFETIAIRVLKLDKIAKTMTSTCPARHSQPVDEPNPALTAWLQELLRFMRSGNQADRSLSHDMQTFFYEDTTIPGEYPWLTFDLFTQCVAILGHAHPRLLPYILQEDAVKLTVHILLRQHDRFLFLTDSGHIGFSARQPCLDGHIVLIPGRDPSNMLYMLNADCTRYVGCASVIGLMGDSLLESLDDMETKWEMVVLR